MSLAVRFSEYGTPDVLRVVDVPPLTAGPGQVRLAVRAAGVNPVDWKILSGGMRRMMPLDLPGGLGSDVAGVVDQVGEGVTAFAVGDEVLGASVTLPTPGRRSPTPPPWWPGPPPFPGRSPRLWPVPGSPPGRFSTSSRSPRGRRC
ncbi:alcohol dehydrogenase catalytic domain-containing protein [Streptomyces griseus]|uniref:alcohol dehydrogenase catalytic domain-containing protein n=1 Tax=Streptomyces griseus TaxID=1911 RepID=UPI001CEF5CF9|nr:alcohol dehydrogenase catalytic domain-containing protein [Streptomyces griseus]